MDKNKALITTTDFDTKELLLKEGFQLAYSQGNVWTFINDKAVMSFDDKHKCAFTNKLCI